MKATTISSIMLAVAVLVTGCHKAEDKDGMGPAQTAGKAIDDAGAKAAAESKEAAANANAAAQQAGANAKEAAHEAN
jgi:colicin import membrane protein